jgi:hypothetical protein
MEATVSGRADALLLPSGGAGRESGVRLIPGGAALGGDQPAVAKRQVAAAASKPVRTISLEGDNPTMMSADAQQQRLLQRLRQAGDQPVAFAELHAGGIDFPAAVVSELELSGFVIERVYDHGRLVGVRLLDPEPPGTPAGPRRRRRHRPR